MKRIMRLGAAAALALAAQVPATSAAVGSPQTAVVAESVTPADGGGCVFDLLGDLPDQSTF